MVSTVSPYSTPNLTALLQDEFNTTTSNNTLSEADTKVDHTVLLDFVIIPLTIIATVILVVGMIAFIIRKKRLDKLRHHLMPLYSFDPAEEGEDWEAELLEEGTDHQHRLKFGKHGASVIASGSDKRIISGDKCMDKMENVP